MNNYFLLMTCGSNGQNSNVTDDRFYYHVILLLLAFFKESCAQSSIYAALVYTITCPSTMTGPEYSLSYVQPSYFLIVIDWKTVHSALDPPLCPRFRGFLISCCNRIKLYSKTLLLRHMIPSLPWILADILYSLSLGPCGDSKRNSLMAPHRWRQWTRTRP
jgi:hypothetical protein